MTTIVFKDGVIAYDSLATDEFGTITSRIVEKKSTHQGCTFFIAGSNSDIQRFIEAYFGKSSDRVLDISAFAIEGNEIFLCGGDGDGGVWKQLLDKSNPRALGSGQKFALAAMDMGADAVKAVEIAIGRDIYSGGEIRTYRMESA